MLTLIIRHSDTSIYWQEYFNTLSDLQKWLKEEQTRPYWKQEYTTEIMDNTPPRPIPPTQEELDAIAKTKTDITDLRHEIKVEAMQLLDAESTIDVKETVAKLIKLLILNDGLK